MLQRQQKKGNTALDCAIQANPHNLEIINLFRLHYQSKSLLGSVGDQARHLFSLCETIYNEDNVSNEQNTLQFALTEAISKGDVSEVQQLIAKGANINALDGKGQNALHLAYRKNTFLNDDGKNVLRNLLVENGVNIFQKDNNGVSCETLAYCIGRGEFTVLNNVYAKVTKPDLKDPILNDLLCSQKTKRP